MKIIKSIKSLISNEKKTNNTKKEIKKNISYSLSLNNDLKDIEIISIKNLSSIYYGLIAKNEIEYNTCFRMLNKQGINSFGFKFNVDLVFCDIKNNVIATYSCLKPQKVTSYQKNAKYLYIFKENMISILEIKLNDIIKVKKNI